MLHNKYYYLAYGSNLNLEEMGIRCPNAKPIGTVLLHGFHLVYKGAKDNYAYLTIEEKEEAIVPLGLFEITKRDIKQLDHYEGYPLLYEKRIIPVMIEGKNVDALIYVMKEAYDYHIPHPSYIKICENGYRDFGFNTAFLEIALQETKENLSKTKKRK